MGHLNEHLILPRLLGVKVIDFPTEDRVRLCRAVNLRTAAFLVPNHPEFFTDWMVDKAISWRCSPLMAHWAAHDVVNASPLAQKFWLANGLIANAPKGGGRAYSLKVAREGRGVLLHPEGQVTWKGDTIGPLRRGAVVMAMQLARELDAEGDSRPVWIVPMAWRYRFLADASVALARERAFIERHTGQRVELDPGLTQEQIAETLKATRVRLMRRGWRNQLHNLIPIAVAPRSVHIRVADPINVRDAVGQDTGVAELLDDLRGRMLAALATAGSV